MKRVFLGFFCLLPALLGACTIQTHTPVLTTAFAQKAIVETGGFSYSCEICRTQDGAVSVTVSDTASAGMVMRCSGSGFAVSYDKIDQSMDFDKVNQNNACLAVYRAFDALAASQQPNAGKTETGYAFYGKTNLGRFTLVQAQDGTLQSLSFPSAALQITFSVPEK